MSFTNESNNNNFQLSEHLNMSIKYNMNVWLNIFFIQHALNSLYNMHLI